MSKSASISPHSILDYGDFVFRKKYSVYEIYLQTETPHLTQIAEVDFKTSMDLHLLPGKVVWYERHHEAINFRVWDYLLPLNRSISFSLDVYGAAVHSFLPMCWN
jgi:hypothetical protein